MKRILLSLALLLIVNSAFAWDLPNRFKLGLNRLAALESINEDGVYFMPTGSLGFGVGPADKPSYGYSGAGDIIYANYTVDGTTGNSTFTPILGIGGAIYVDLAQLINSGGLDPIKLDGGINAIGPQIEGLVPSAQIVWNFQTGEEIKAIHLTAPFDFLSGGTPTRIIKTR